MSNLGFNYSVFLCSAMENTLGKWNIPYLALPFCIMGVSSFIAFPAIGGTEEILTSSLNSSSISNESLFFEHDPYGKV